MIYCWVIPNSLTGDFVKNQRPGVSPELFYVQYNFVSSVNLSCLFF